MKTILLIALTILSVLFLVVVFSVSRQKRRPLPLYYSTPVGEDEQGNTHVYVLSPADSDLRYYPVFRTKEACVAFFESIGRTRFPIVEGTLTSLNRALDEDPLFSQCGIVIDPDSADEAVFSPEERRNA